MLIVAGAMTLPGIPRADAQPNGHCGGTAANVQRWGDPTRSTEFDDWSALAWVQAIGQVSILQASEAPAALECRHYTTLEVSAERRLAIGEIVHVHVRPGLWDTDKMRIDMTQYRPLARLFGNYYASLSEPFTHERQSYEEWAAEQKEKA